MTSEVQSSLHFEESQIDQASELQSSLHFEEESLKSQQSYQVERPREVYFVHPSFD